VRHWVTVYSAADPPQLGDLMPIGAGLILIAMAVGILFFRIPEWLHGQVARKSIGFVLLAVGTPLTLISTVGTFLPRHTWSERLRAGETEYVEGVITNFVPMPSGCHGQEHFDIGSQHFEYADCRITTGFNHSSTEGGPVRAGETVRVNFVDASNGNLIIKLQIAE
jgi:hypothetical protein